MDSDTGRAFVLARRCRHSWRPARVCVAALEQKGIPDMDSTIEHFRDGGWVMFVIFAVGLVGTGAAGRFAWRGEHQLLAFIRWNLLSVGVAGAFGFCVAMLKVFAYVEERSPPDQRLLVLMAGTRESLNNPTAALMFALLVATLTAVGLRRFPLPNPSAVPR